MRVLSQTCPHDTHYSSLLLLLSQITLTQRKRTLTHPLTSLFGFNKIRPSYHLVINYFQQN